MTRPLAEQVALADEGMREQALYDESVRMDELPFPRCPQEIEWVILASRLVIDFSEVAVQEVLQEAWTAKDAADQANLPVADDQLLVAELIARHRLSLRRGRNTDVVGLDPVYPTWRTTHAIGKGSSEFPWGRDG